MFFEATFFSQLLSDFLAKAAKQPQRKHKNGRCSLLDQFVIWMLDNPISGVDCERFMSVMKWMSSSLNDNMNPTTKCARSFATWNFDIWCK